MALPESSFTKKSLASADKLAKDIEAGQRKFFGKQKPFKVGKKRK